MPSSPAASSRTSASLSGLEVAVLAEELDAKLKGSYVSNIYSMNGSQLLIMKNGDAEWTLVLSPRYGAWISERMAEHGVTDLFTTSLRREIERAKLERVGQIDLDRIFEFVFVNRGQKLGLVLEMVPPGNIILLDQEKKVKRVLREIRGPHRRLVRGETYVPPPQNRLQPNEIKEENLLEILRRDQRVGRALGRGIALPRKYIDEVLARAGLEQDGSSPDSPEKVRELKTAVESVLSEARKHTIFLTEEKDGTQELMVVRPTRRAIARTASEIGALVDELFEPLLRGQGEEGEPTEADKKVLELEASLDALRKEISENEGRAALAKGLAARAQTLPPLEVLLLVEEEAGAQGLPAALRTNLETITSSAAIASELYDYAKQQNAESERIRSVIKSLEARKETARKKAPKESASKKLHRGTKKDWYEKFRWFKTSEGKLAVGGRDAQSNTILIKRHLEDDDVIYHADLFGSPFFILKKGRTQTDGEVREVAGATVSFSSAWKTGLGAADAYWVVPDQVSAAAPTGEFLAKGSFMIKGKKNFVSRNLVQISVGLDPEGRIVAGPEEAVAKNAREYLTLVPHREKASDTAKRVLTELKRLATAGAELALTVDDVLRVLPAGGGKIIRKKGLAKEY